MRAQGADYSVWDDSNSTPQHVDFNKAKANGLSFVGIKASQNYADEDFQINWLNARNAGLLRMAYHFLDWRTSELYQAALFCNLLKNDIGELPPVVDFEMSEFAPEKAVCDGKLWNFVSYVERTLGRKPIIYTGYYYWYEHTFLGAGWAQYPLWLAWYADESVIKVPPPWKRWTFWQYTSHGDGLKYGSEAKDLDMNWFNGTEEELKAFSNGQPLPPPPPPAYPLYKTLCAVNVRNQPNEAGSTIIGILPAGVVIGIDTVDTANGRSHYKGYSGYPAAGWVWSAYIAPIKKG